MVAPKTGLVGNLDYVEVAHIAPPYLEALLHGTRLRVVVLYTVTVTARGSDTKLDYSSIECSVQSSHVMQDDRDFKGTRITNIEGTAKYVMGGGESLKHENWLEEKVFGSPVRVNYPTRGIVACEIKAAGHPQLFLWPDTDFTISYRDGEGQQYKLSGRWAEPPFAIRTNCPHGCVGVSHWRSSDRISF